METVSADEVIAEFLPKVETIEVDILGKKYSFSGIKDDKWFKSLKSYGGLGFDGDFAILQECIKPDMVCLDIGAHLGLVSLKMAELASEVYAFEASPICAHLCQKNIASTSKIRFSSAIIGRDSDWVGWNELSNCLSSSHYVNGGPNKTASIDSFNFPKVDFIKIDVEGAELDVLEGAQRTLKRCNPIVLLEFNTFAFVHWRSIFPRDALRKIQSYFSHIEVLYKHDRTREILKGGGEEDFLSRNFLRGLTDDLLCR